MDQKKRLMELAVPARAVELKEAGNAQFLRGAEAEALASYAAALTAIAEAAALPVAELNTLPKGSPLGLLAVALYGNTAHAHIAAKRWEDAIAAANLALDIDPAHEKNRLRLLHAQKERDSEQHSKPPKLSTLTAVAPPGAAAASGASGRPTTVTVNVGGTTVPLTTVGSGSSADVGRAMTDGVALNNQGVALNNQKRHAEALACFQRSLALKSKAFGTKSKHALITMSGVADALLGLKRLEEARTAAQQMLDIALEIKEADQARIAREILADVKHAMARAGNA
jgi:tetratricopeptide (TPR) repeat protein